MHQFLLLHLQLPVKATKEQATDTLVGEVEATATGTGTDWTIPAGLELVKANTHKLIGKHVLQYIREALENQDWNIREHGGVNNCPSVVRLTQGKSCKNCDEYWDETTYSFLTEDARSQIEDNDRFQTVPFLAGPQNITTPVEGQDINDGNDVRHSLTDTDLTETFGIAA